MSVAVRLPDYASAAPACGSRPAALLFGVVLIATGVQLAVVHPARNYLLDFRCYYATGVGLQRGINPYDHAALAAQVTLAGEQAIVPYVYPPPTLLIPRLLALLPYPDGQIPWLMIQFALAVTALVLLGRALRLPAGSSTAALIGVTFVLSHPFAQLFRWGQWDMLPLVLLAGTALAFERERPGWAGVLLALAGVAKVTPLLCLGVLILRREWRALIAAGATLFAVVSAAGALLPREVWPAWLTTLGRLAADVSPQNESLRGWLFAAFTTFVHQGRTWTPWLELGPAGATRLYLCLSAALVLGGAVWMMARRKHLRTAECIAAALPAVLLISPVTWPHHAVILLIPLAYACAAYARCPRRRPLETACLAAALLALLCAPVQQLSLELPDWLHHLAAPTTTYACAALGLFFLLRFPQTPPCRGLS